MKTVCFCVYGKVQGVMFRRTFCLGANKRKLIGGATNDREDRSRVICTLKGEQNEIDLFIEQLRKLDLLNSWGAKVERVETLSEVLELDCHDVTTETVGDRPWNNDIKYYI